MELTRHRNEFILHNKGEMTNVVQLSDMFYYENYSVIFVYRTASGYVYIYLVCYLYKRTQTNAF